MRSQMGKNTICTFGAITIEYSAVGLFKISVRFEVRKGTLLGHGIVISEVIYPDHSISAFMLFSQIQLGLVHEAVPDVNAVEDSQLHCGNPSLSRDLAEHSP